MTDVASALFSLAPGLQANSKRGSGYVMIQCPFHGSGQEKTPSCSVSLEKPVFFCHACQASGHLSKILKSFGLGREGVSTILKATGMDKPGPALSARGKVAARLTASTNVYRGPFILDEDILDDYRMAPKALMRQGFDKRTLRHFEVGYDVSNMRITFPIRNIYGELVGISGRAILDYQEPRYKIYDSEMKLRDGFHIPEDYSMEEVKDAVLWHAHVVRPFFYTNTEQDEPFIVTEGFKACMWTWQAGYQSTVALIGAYLTGLHAELIASTVQYVILFLDNNEAGWRGTVRAGRILSQYGIDVRVAAYPDEREQPDDLTTEEVRLSIKNAERYIHWRQHDHVQRFLHEDAKRWRPRGPAPG
jgi:DNA primase